MSVLNEVTKYKYSNNLKIETTVFFLSIMIHIFFLLK